MLGGNLLSCVMLSQCWHIVVWNIAQRRKESHRRVFADDYKNILGARRLASLPELFAAADCKFQFDAATIKPLIELAITELKKL